MGQRDELLEIISRKEGPARTAELAPELRVSESSIRSYISELKKKSLVDGDFKVGWFITDRGKEALEGSKDITKTLEDIKQDCLSQFRYFGDLAGVDSDLLDASSELFKNQDMRDMNEMKRVMAEMNVPQVSRQRWEANYRGYLRNTTPEATRDVLYPLPEAVAVKPSVSKSGASVETGTESRSFVIEGNAIHRTVEDMGEFTFKEALQVVAAQRGTSPQPKDGGVTMLSDLADAVSKLNPNKPLTIKEILDIFEVFKTKDEDKGDPPSTQPGYFVDEEGELKELKPGAPIVIRRVEQQASKTFVMDEGGNLVEHDPSKPIVIKVNTPAPSENPLAMMPFPAMGADGQPLFDKEGKPVIVNLEPMMKYLGFQSGEKRANERHAALMGLTDVVKENVADGIQALRDAAAEAKSSRGTKELSSKGGTQQKKAKCGGCQQEFLLPAEPLKPLETLACPHCGQTYSSEEIMGP